MTLDELAELMSEPPHGANHGRRRNDEGGWTPLETDDIKSRKRPPEMMRHGTVYAYRKQKCRCSFCRIAHAERQRRWRSTP